LSAQLAHCVDQRLGFEGFVEGLGRAELARHSQIVIGFRGTETILLVEDDEDVRAFTAEFLAELGYHVLLAGDARSALKTLEREPDIALLFTDLGLPNGVNGRQLAEEARRRRPGLKVLFTTGYARNAIVHHGRLDPGVELIGKPFTHTNLADRIGRILGRPR
jgi:CheY-like chemotaxis protein